MKDKTKNCTCDVCMRYREYKLFLERIPDQATRSYFEEFYSFHAEIDETLSCYRHYNDNLRRMYPRIWKEVTTLTYLDKDDAEFPEKQL